LYFFFFFFFFQAEDGIRDRTVTGVQTCALPILRECGEILLRDVEHTERRETSEQLQLLRALGRKSAEQLRRDELSVEPKRRRKADRVQCTVRKPVPAADCLRHGMAERQA